MIAKLAQGVFQGLLILALYFQIGGNYAEGSNMNKADIDTV